MTRTRLAVAATAVTAITLALAGCGSSPSDQGGDALTLWTFKQSHKAALEAVGEAWSKTSGVPVEVSAYSSGDTYTTKIQSSAQSGGLPDILSLHNNGENWQMAQAGVTTDLSDEFDESWQAEFLPGLLDAGELTEAAIENSGDDPATTLKDLKAGSAYSIPYLAGTPGVVFANKKLLSEAGVDTENPPATYEEWVAAIEATRAVDESTGGLAIGLQIPETAYFWLYRPLAYAFLGEDAFYGRQGKSASPAWDSAESVKSLELYDQLSPLWMPGVLGLDIDPADQAFASGKAAWSVGGTFSLGNLTAFGMSADDLMVFPIPPSEDGAVKELSYLAGPLVEAAVTEKSDKKDEAIDFIKFLTSPEGAAIFAAEANDLPATAIDPAELPTDLLRQLVGLVAEKPGVPSFNPNDFSADPVGTVGHDTAVALAKLAAKTATPEEVAAELTDIYRAAWESAE